MHNLLNIKVLLPNGTALSSSVKIDGPYFRCPPCSRSPSCWRVRFPINRQASLPPSAGSGSPTTMRQVSDVRTERRKIPYAAEAFPHSSSLVIKLRGKLTSNSSQAARCRDEKTQIHMLERTCRCNAVAKSSAAQNARCQQVHRMMSDEARTLSQGRNCNGNSTARFD